MTFKQVQTVVEGMGGFVENLSSSGGSSPGETACQHDIKGPPRPVLGYRGGR